MVRKPELCVLQMIGGIDINNLTDDFVEDVMLQSKPLQGILMGIRLRQAVSTFCVCGLRNPKLNASTTTILEIKFEIRSTFNQDQKSLSHQNYTTHELRMT